MRAIRTADVSDNLQKQAEPLGYVGRSKKFE